MPLRVNFNILNQKGTPAFYSDIFANRPAAGYAGRVFISTDTGAIYEDNGSTWTLIADAGAGTTGTLQQVTTNGNTTTQGITITAGGLSSNSINNTALTTGSVLFSGASGLITQDNANLFWDDTNNRLGIGTAAPGAPLDVHSTGTAAQFNGTGINNAYVLFQNAGANKWRIGNLYNAGANSFEFVDAARSTNVMSLRSTGTYTEVFINGYNTINNIANLSSSGNYAINPSLTISIPASTSFNSGASYSGMATSLLNTWQGNNTFPIGAVMSGLNAVNRQTFDAAGTTITVSQSTGLRAITALNIGMQTAGSNNGTISHGAGMLIQGVYPTASANVTFTNYYGLLINQQDEYGTVTFTNRWGIYQQGTSDKNYFGGNMLIGSTTDNGAKLQVTGTSNLNGAVTIKGSGTTNATYGLTVLNSSNSTNFYVNDAGNAYINSYVGIGTNPSSSYLLNVNGTSNYSGLATFNALGNQIKIGSGGGTDGFIGMGSGSSSLFIGDYSSGTKGLTINLSTGATTFSNSVTIKSGNSAIFYRSDNAIYTTMYDGGSGATAGFILNNTNSEGFNFQNNGTSIVRMPSTNNVLIGTTTDNGSKLQVQGEIRSQGASATLYFQNQSNSNYYAFYGNLTNIYLYNQAVGNIGSFNPTTGIYTPLSDINKKKDFENSTIGLNAILGLKPTLYRMKTESNTEKHLGFIAQEVKEFIPQAYVENQDFIGLNDRPIIAALVKAIQELNEKLQRNNIN